MSTKLIEVILRVYEYLTHTSFVYFSYSFYIDAKAAGGGNTLNLSPDDLIVVVRDMNVRTISNSHKYCCGSC